MILRLASTPLGGALELIRPSRHCRTCGKWISVDDFQGPLFLAAGDKLEGREDFTKAGVVYTAFKKQ